MQYLFLIVLNSAWIFSFSQQIENEGKKDFTKLKSGMSEKQIIKTVGEPIKIESFRTVKPSTHDTTVFWRYENDLTLIITNHYFQNIERNFSLILIRLQEWADPKNKDSLRVIYSK